MLESAKRNLKIKKFSKFSLASYSILLLITFLVVFFSRSYWLQGGNIKVASAQNSSGILPGLALPETDRKYLWDIEHHATLLRVHGFEQIKSALLSDEDDSLLSLFSDNFTATIPSEEGAHQIDFHYAQALKTSAKSASFLILDQKALASWFPTQKDSA